MVQRLAVVLDQHVLVIAADTHTHQTYPPMIDTHIHKVTETPWHGRACVNTRARTHTQEKNGEKEKQKVNEGAAEQDWNTDGESEAQREEQENV